jgi:hypothetical protein
MPSAMNALLDAYMHGNGGHRGARCSHGTHRPGTLPFATPGSHGGTGQRRSP